MSATAYPLTWPDGLPRTITRATSAFKTALPAALQNVQSSLQLFGRDSGKAVSNVILSSNVTLGANNPADPGVAAWFTWDGEQRCIAVDRYPKVQDNLQAIHHILEARRTEMRHGGLHIVRQTFKGFTALPAPDSEPWTTVLGVPATASREKVEAAYREKAKTAHPDRGGARADWDRLSRAYEQAKQQVPA
jgi:hypothetical protein